LPGLGNLRNRFLETTNNMLYNGNVCFGDTVSCNKTPPSLGLIISRGRYPSVKMMRIRTTNRNFIERQNRRFGYIISILTRIHEINTVVPEIKLNCAWFASVLIFSASLFSGYVTCIMITSMLHYRTSNSDSIA
jgi:hypothetical protein